MKIIKIVSHTSEPSESVARLNEKLGTVNQDVVEFHYGKGVNKLKQYEFFKANDIPHAPFSTKIEDAKKWLKNGHAVVCREFIKSQKGNGLHVAGSEAELVEAKVYTKYMKKKREFRVNLFKHKVVNIREKLGKADKYFIATTGNGYTTTHVKSPISNEAYLRSIAEQASMVSTSDFIGVDVGYNQFYDEYFVLEVNSGPSIEGSSVAEFVQAMKEAANV